MPGVNPNAPQSTATANQVILQQKVRRITVYCGAKKEVTTAENIKGSSFRCPLCELALVYLPNEHRLGSHGRSSQNIGHELRRVEEMGTIGSMAAAAPVKK